MIKNTVSCAASISQQSQSLQSQSNNHLNAHHWYDLTVTRGLDPDWIRANCRSVSKEEASDLLGYPANCGGIWIEGANGRGQFKPDVPWKSKDDPKGKAPKYRSPKGEYGGFLPKHPTDPNYWTNIERLKEQLCYQMDGNPCLNVTEGPLKAIEMCANGLPTIALPGVEMGLTSKTANIQGRRYLVPELEWAASIGVELNIIFDADAATNRNVVIGQLNLARKWQEVTGKQAYSCTSLWKEEEGKGVDDYIQANGADKFKKDVMAKALTIDAWEKQFAGNEDNYQATGKPPSPRKLAQELAEKHQPTWAFHNEQKTWRIWDEKCWGAVEDDVFSKIVLLEIESRGIQFDTLAYVENTIKLLRLKLLVEKWETFDRKRYVAFENGVLDMETGELLTHSPGMRFTCYIPRQYSILHNLSALHPLEALQQYCPHTHSYMMKAMGGDRQQVMKLLAIANAVLKWRFSEFQMFVHLIGEPGAGKGTFIRLLQLLVGKPNHRSATLGKLSDDYTIANIIDSQMVVCPDEDKKNGNHGGLKALTGGDDISYREIYKKPASSPFYGGLMVVSNTAIFAGETSGLERRLSLVNFKHRLTAHERNPKIEELIEGELSALTAVALTLADSQVEQLIKGIGAGDIPEFKAQSWKLTIDTNSVALHIEEHLVHAPSSCTEVSKLYEDYRELCGSFGRIPMEKTRYSQELTRIAADHMDWDLSADRTTISGKQCRVIRGVRLRSGGVDDSIPLPSELLAKTAKTALDSKKTAGESVLSSLPDKDFSDSRQHLPKKLSKEIFTSPEVSEEIANPQKPAKTDNPAVLSAGQGFGAVSEAVSELSNAGSRCLDEIGSYIEIARYLIEEGCDWETYQVAMMKDGQSLPADIRAQVWAALSPGERNYIKALKIAAQAPENPKQMTLDIKVEEIRQDSRYIKGHDGEEHWA